MKKLDVLFIALPPVSPVWYSSTDETTSSSENPPIHPPIRVLYLANSIFKKDYVNSVKCVDFSIYDYSSYTSEGQIEDFVKATLLDKIPQETPPIIAISLMFSSGYDFFRIVCKMVDICWPGSTVIAGGAHVSNSIEYVLDNDPLVDYVVCGEGEKALPEILHSIATDSLQNILGVHSNGNIKKMPGGVFERTQSVDDLDIDFTVYPQILDMEFYTTSTSIFSLSKTSLEAKSFSIMSSRGCPVRCTFCSAHTIHGYRPRWRSMENILAEIHWLNEHYGVTKFYLMDDNFVPKKRAIELFNALAEISIPEIEIVVQNFSINHSDHDTIDAVAAANITNVAYAIESGSPEVQQRIKKYVQLEHAFDVVRYSQSKGMNVRCFYIVGFPGETMEEIQETFDFARKLGADWSTFNIAIPLPGTEMYAEFIKMGVIEDGPAYWRITSMRDRLFDTPEFTASDIKELAYSANLSVNFVNNPAIFKGDYDNAKNIFTNFVHSVDFHIFAFDCLRRIHDLTGDPQGAEKILSHMKHLINNNSKSKSFKKYLGLLEPDIQAYLTEVVPENRTVS